MLENINGSDQGSEAIKKLDRNSRKLLELITSLSDADIELLRQINVLKDKVDVKRYEFSQIKNNGYDKPYRTLISLNVTQLQELGLPNIGYGWWWFEFLPDAWTGASCGSLKAKNFHTGDVFENCGNGGWIQLATTSKTDILTSQLSNLWEVSGNRVSNISKVGNVVTFNLNFKCGTKGYGTAIYQVPQQFRLPQVTNLNGVGTNATGVKTLIDLFYDSGDGFIKVNSVTSDAVNISIAIPINV